jgi:hypothetical protein
MSDRTIPESDLKDLEEGNSDPDGHSTWNTIEGTVTVDELLNEEDFATLLIEPTPGDSLYIEEPDSPGDSGGSNTPHHSPVDAEETRS